MTTTTPTRSAHIDLDWSKMDMMRYLLEKERADFIRFEQEYQITGFGGMPEPLVADVHYREAKAVLSPVPETNSEAAGSW